MQVFIQLVTLQSSSCYPYVAQARIAKPASPSICRMNANQQWRECIKLSDDLGKHMGS